MAKKKTPFNIFTSTTAKQQPPRVSTPQEAAQQLDRKRWQWN